MKIITRLRRYEIRFGWTLWLQTSSPVVVKHFLFIWFIKKLKPTDVDKKPQVLPGTEMMYEGRRYMYLKADSNIAKGSMVKRC